MERQHLIDLEQGFRWHGKKLCSLLVAVQLLVSDVLAGSVSERLRHKRTLNPGPDDGQRHSHRRPD